MHSADFDLLRRVAAGEITAVKLPAELDAHINYLISRGWIVRTMPGRYSLTDSGKAAMHLYVQESERQREQDAQRNREQRVQEAQAKDDKRKAAKHDYRIAAFEVILVYILGLLTPEKYLDEVIAFFKELIGQFLGLFH